MIKRSKPANFHHNKLSGLFFFLITGQKGELKNAQDNLFYHVLNSGLGIGNLPLSTTGPEDVMFLSNANCETPK